MKATEIDGIWEENLSYVRRAHEEKLDRMIQAGLERAAGTGEAPNVPPIPADLPGVFAHLRFLNFALWHIEDEARRRDTSDAYIATTKRWIDPHNQSRNDTMEAIDALLEPLFPMPPEAPIHTETPGVAFDRLAVLALKIHHTKIEAERSDAAAEYRASMKERIALLETQGEDLRAALRSLLSDLAAGRRAFRRYRQFKLYNDPESNPAVRAGSKRS